MDRVLLRLGLLIAFLSMPLAANAQRRRPARPPAQLEEQEEEEQPAEEETEPTEPGEVEEDGQPEDAAQDEGAQTEGGLQLRAPMLGQDRQPETAETDEQPGLSPEESGRRILQPENGEAEEPETEGGPLGPWATKALPLFTINGYFRTRFELFHQFHLGWNYASDGTPEPLNPPFPRPVEAGLPLCGEGSDFESDRCDNNTLAGANLRLRLNPQINVSDQVQINAQIDLLDNLVLGSTPEGFDVIGSQPAAANPWAPIRAFSATQVPPSSRNSLQDSVAVRRAWAQVRTELGVLRFGRMGSEWGLGVLANGGDQLNSDFGDTVDRVLFATRIAGVMVVPMIDFPAEGPTSRAEYEHIGQPYDVSQLDDVNQYILAIARKLDEDELRDRLQLGQAALQGGVYLVYRDQLLTTEYTEAPLGSSPISAAVVRRGAQAWIPDLWLQLQYRKLHLELEWVFVYGTIDSIGSANEFDDFTVFQYGGVLQVDYRLMSDKLRLGFESGLASGDPDVEGLSPRQGLLTQVNDDTASTFQFDRDFNIDLILWEEIYRTLAGAYYFRPNISYDFISNAQGQLFGARLDVVYSRAMYPVQTRGNDANLGVEIDAQLYYRSEDGPSVLDGFYAGLQYGILIPLGGLGPQANEPDVDLSSAQTLQAILAVVY